MTIHLNKKALEHARKLVEQGDVVRDERDEWGAHEPTAEDENRFIERNGWDEYALWHLGEDRDKSDETKGRFSFPYGDLKKVRRSAVIAIESRASQNDHADIAREAKRLLDLIDGE